MPIYEKIQRIREDSLKLDWTPDKSFPKAGKMIPFVSGDKIRTQFAPLWAKHKVDFGQDVIETKIHPDLAGKGYGQTYEVKVRFILTDIEDGSQDSAVSVGFAGADDIHAPKTAVAYAYNCYMTGKFQINDGNDAEEDAEAEVVNKLSAMAMPETAKTPSKTEETVKKVSAPEHLPKIPVKAVSNPNTLTIAERKAADRSLEKVVKWYEDGKIVESEYQKVQELYDALSNPADVHYLMGIVRNIEQNVTKGSTEAGF